MQSKYYSGVDLLNAKCPFSFTIGGRSIGKSFYWKAYCIRRWLKSGYKKKFIYLRRRGTELTLAMSDFIKDVGEKFPQITAFEVRGDEKDEMYVLIDGEWHLLGFCYHLIEVNKVKSVPKYGDVETIFYDEMLPEDLRYLKPSEPYYEPMLLMSFFVSVARGYGKVIREDCKLIGASNNITIYNPYFSFFAVDLTGKNKFCQNEVYAELVTNEAIAQEIANTKFGTILKNTPYGAYALSNNALRDTKRNIKKRHEKATPYIMLWNIDRWYTAYYHTDGSLTFTDITDLTFPRKYQVTEPPDEFIEVPLLVGKMYKTICDVQKNDQLYYETPQIKGALHGLFVRR